MDNKKMLQYEDSNSTIKENLNWLYANEEKFSHKQFIYLLKDLMGQNDKQRRFFVANVGIGLCCKRHGGKTKMKQRNKKEKFNIGENPLSEINYPGCVYTKDDIEEAKQIRKEENKEIREWCYKMIEESDVDRPTMIKICIDKFGRRGRRLLKTIESKILNKEAI